MLAHELSHWFLTDLCMPPAVQEAIMDQFILCWRMPQAVVSFAVRETGGFVFALEVLLTMYAALAPPLDLVTRAAMVCNVGLLVYTPEGRLERIGSGVHEVNIELDEREAMACARDALRLGRWVPDPRGFVAVPFEVAGVALAIVAVDLTIEEQVEAG